MAAISEHTKKNPQQTLSTPPSLFSKLPAELLERVVLCLSDYGLPSLGASNHDLKGRVQSSANSLNALSIQSFIEDLKEKGDFPSHRQPLKKILENLNPPTPNKHENSMEVKERISLLKAELIGVIKNFDVVFLNNLEQQKKYHNSTKDILKIAIICAKIDNPESPNIEENKIQLARGLLEFNNINAALLVARSLSNEENAQSIITYLSIFLLKASKIDEARHVAMFISDENDKEGLLFSIFQALFEVGKIEEAYQIANSLSQKSVKEALFSYLDSELAFPFADDKLIQAHQLKERLLNDSK